MSGIPPAILEQRIVCSIAASIQFNLPANVLLAVAEIENGRPGQQSPNANGTRDIGFMQFNTSYLASLAQYGIRPEHVASSNCYPFDLAAWRIAGHLQRDQGDIWTRAANYHSRTPKYNLIYRKKLLNAAAKWETWLTENFKVRDITP